MLKKNNSAEQVHSNQLQMSTEQPTKHFQKKSAPASPDVRRPLMFPHLPFEYKYIHEKKLANSKYLSFALSIPRKLLLRIVVVKPSSWLT